MNAKTQNAGGASFCDSGGTDGAVDGAGNPLTVMAYDMETLRAVYPGPERAVSGLQYVSDWSDASKRQMGVACCGVENIETGEARIFTENLLPVWTDGQFRDLHKALTEADLLISFGGGDTTDSGFDNAVLAGNGIEIDPAKCLDIRLAIKRATGGNLPKGLTLGKLAQANADPEFPSLGRGKTGDGGLAPEQWARGEYQTVIDYCLKGDVKMVADLWRKHQRDGCLLLPDGSRVTLSLPGQGSSSLAPEDVSSEQNNSSQHPNSERSQHGEQPRTAGNSTPRTDGGEPGAVRPDRSTGTPADDLRSGTGSAGQPVEQMLVGNRGTEPGADSGDRAGDRLSGGTDSSAAVNVQPDARRELRLVQPVAQLRQKADVQPVARVKKPASGATGGTKAKSSDSDELQPPAISGCEWRFTGYGWELWKRVPSISGNGKRSSKRKYLAYYSREAVKRLHDAREKTTHARTA